MDYEMYQAAIEHDKASPARLALEPYWQSIILIATSDDPIETLNEEAIWLEEDGSLTLATGGPHVEFSPGGEIRGAWGKGWIYSQPQTAQDTEAARFLSDLLNELRSLA